VTSDRTARDYLEQAQARRIAVGALFSTRAYPSVVRESQDVVELILKGAFRFVSVEPAKRYDVDDLVEQFIDRFPEEWRQVIGELGPALTQLAQDRAPAFYGREAEDIPPSELFSEADARRAMAVADRLLDLYTRLLGGKR
jgi:HEPN domain-containing protein